MGSDRIADTVRDEEDCGGHRLFRSACDVGREECPDHWRDCQLCPRYIDIGESEGYLLTPGSVPNTWRMYMPHLVHFMLSVGSNDSANIPVKAGMSENMAMATDDD